jgi:excisionase family DNA binding protein
MKIKDLFTAPQVAKICSMDLKTIHNWVNRGEINFFRTPGRHLRFKREHVIEFLEKFNYPIPRELLSPRSKVLVLDSDQEKLNPIKIALSESADVLTYSDTFEAMLNIGKENPSLVLLNSKTDIDILRVVKKIANHEKNISIVMYGTANESDASFLDAGALKCLKTQEPDHIALEAIKTLKIFRKSA